MFFPISSFAFQCHHSYHFRSSHGQSIHSISKFLHRKERFFSETSKQFEQRRWISDHSRITKLYASSTSPSTSPSTFPPTFPSRSSGNYYKNDKTNDILDSVITRFSDRDNLVALWQAKGSHYVSYNNLLHLNQILTSYTTDRSKAQKKSLLNELTLTYFARFHNIIREEYQYEKKGIETRTNTWSDKKLQKEGYSLFYLKPTSRGHLFQDKVYRFAKQTKDELGYHRFSNGDIVKISLGNPMSPSAIDGIVLDRRSKYIDICVPKTTQLNLQLTYRLDAFVNRIVYERMLNSLQLFLDPHPSDDGSIPITRSLRDLLMYSYPNSMLTLAKSPGGLRMALPELTSTGSTQSSNRSNTQVSSEEIIKARLEQRVSHTIAYPSVLATTSMEDQILLSKSKSSFPKFTNVSNSFSNDTSSNIADTMTSPMASPVRNLVDSMTNRSTATIGGKVVTVADALNAFKTSSSTNDFVEELVHLRDEIELQSSSQSSSSSQKTMSLEQMSTRRSTIDDIPVFKSNARLRQMAEKSITSLLPGCRALTKEDVNIAFQNIVATKNSTLNPSQKRALEGALLRPLSLIQGPPGTGKTRTAAMILTTLVAAHKLRMSNGGDDARGLKLHKILACAHSNIATDNLVEWLAKLGVNVVRVGRPANIRSKLWEHTLDMKLQQDEDVIKAKEALDKASETYEGLKSTSERTTISLLEKTLPSLRQNIRNARKKLEEAEAAAAGKILYSAEVVVSTCISAGSEIMTNFLQLFSSKFSTVLVDEAAQCAESAILPAIIHGCERLILVGDQNQLPPLVNSPEALEQGLGVSLFARLVAGGFEPYLLTEQYRMHPSIALFPSNQFYGGKVTSKVVPSERPTPMGIDWSNPLMPIMFINVSPVLSKLNSKDVDNMNHIRNDEKSIGQLEGYEISSESVKSSYVNYAEVSIVMNIVEDLLDRNNISLRDIGIISPYNGQVSEIIHQCRMKEWVVDSISDTKDVKAMKAGLKIDKKPLKLWKVLTTTKEKTNSAIKTTSMMSMDKKEKMEWMENNIEFLTSNSIDSSTVTISHVDSQEISIDANKEWTDENLPYGRGIKLNPSSSEPIMDDTEDTKDFYKVTIDPDDENDENKQGNSPNSHPNMERNEIEVKSVDGFQGREKEMIILSAVRSNTVGNTGFLKDWRRLNVAITRARSGLIVVGDKNTLSHDENWKDFIDWCVKNQCYREADIDHESIYEQYQQLFKSKKQRKQDNERRYYRDKLF